MAGPNPLAALFSWANGVKRRVSNPLETIGLGMIRGAEDLKEMGRNDDIAYGLNGMKSVLITPEQKAQAAKASADFGANMGMAGTIDRSMLEKAFPQVDFRLSQFGDKATLGKVVVPKELRGQGVGTEFMEALTKAADEDGAQLALTPSNHFGGSKSRLVDFYRRFGFVPNKGRKADYSISESMYRDAVK